jgi:hypothetical protein
MQLEGSGILNYIQLPHGRSNPQLACSKSVSVVWWHGGSNSGMESSGE